MNLVDLLAVSGYLWELSEIVRLPSNITTTSTTSVHELETKLAERLERLGTIETTPVPTARTGPVGTLSP